MHLETKMKPFREHSVVSRTWKHNVLSTKKYTELVVFETKTIGQLKIHEANKVFLLKGLNTIAYMDNFTLLNLLERPRVVSSHKPVAVLFKKVFV